MSETNFNIKIIYDQMNDGNVIFTYKGDISSDLITDALNIVEEKLKNEKSKNKIKRRIYYVLVECLQNLYHHKDKPPDLINLGNNFAMFVLSKGNDSSYKISTGNFITKDKIQILKDRIDQINSLSAKELKALYKLVLNNQEFSEKGGGGLGMIDIVKRTKNKLSYKFHNFGNNDYFYMLNIKVD